MSEYGIIGYGAYIPRLRLERSAIAAAHAWMAPGLRGAAKGMRAFCSWDEDAITMAVEAARGALDDAQKVALRDLVVASTTLPYADLGNATIVAGALGLGDHVAATDSTGYQRAATARLAEQLDAATGVRLLIASERPVGKPASMQEISSGAGAAALVLGSDGVVARYVGGASRRSAFIDHFRVAGNSHDYQWEERWVRDEGYAKLVPAAVAAALASASLTIADIDHLIVPSPMRGLAAAMGKAVGFTGVASTALDEACGYAGVAQPLLQLVEALEQATPGQRLLLVGFGQGVDVMIFEATAAIADYRSPRPVSAALADRLMTTDYMRMLSFYGGVSLEWGMRAERASKASLTEQFRSSAQLADFSAGKCAACGTVQFPVLAYCVNPECVAPVAQFTPQSLAGELGKVFTLYRRPAFLLSVTAALCRLRPVRLGSSCPDGNCRRRSTGLRGRHRLAHGLPGQGARRASGLQPLFLEGDAARRRTGTLTMATGIKDKVAILGMGCSRFGERWDVGTAELLSEAFEEALADAGVDRSQIEAAWYGSCQDPVNVGNSAIPASTALRLDGIPVSRLENMCATGTEALRGAAYAVASGAVDIALAIGAEKLKDTGYGGLPTPYKGTFNDLWQPMGSAPAGFAQLAAGYRAKHGVDKGDFKRALAHVSWKSHQNGVHSPKGASA